MPGRLTALVIGEPLKPLAVPSISVDLMRLASETACSAVLCPPTLVMSHSVTLLVRPLVFDVSQPVQCSKSVPSKAAVKTAIGRCLAPFTHCTEVGVVLPGVMTAFALCQTFEDIHWPVPIAYWSRRESNPGAVQFLGQPAVVSRASFPPRATTLIVPSSVLPVDANLGPVNPVWRINLSPLHRRPPLWMSDTCLTLWISSARTPGSPDSYPLRDTKHSCPRS